MQLRENCQYAIVVPTSMGVQDMSHERSAGAVIGYLLHAGDERGIECDLRSRHTSA